MSGERAASGDLVPFGKYRGQPVGVMIADHGYCEWLLSQPWLQARYGTVYNVLINNGAEPQDSPEHNEMQARFLADEWCLRLAGLLRPELGDDKGLSYALAQARAIPPVQEFRDRVQLLTSEPSVSGRSMEDHGWDVSFRAIPAAAGVQVTSLPPCTCHCDHSICAWGVQCQGGPRGCRHYQHTEQRRDDWRRFGGHCTPGCPYGEGGELQEPTTGTTGERTRKGWWLREYSGQPRPVTGVSSFMVQAELKPDLGDDYPAVLRQVKTYPHTPGAGYRVVVARRHDFRMVTWEQVQEIFATAHIRLVNESDISGRPAAGQPAATRAIQAADGGEEHPGLFD